ncbi:S8 family serine peptidase [Streptomyces sp. NPDC015130]|uniref:S8 family serine peptidase n=1 Tax=Streptomyces sp. NPDC015130 TaxID=3364940 RepID=UPI0036F701C7
MSAQTVGAAEAERYAGCPTLSAFRQHESDPASVARSAAGVELGSVYRSALNGFSAELTPAVVAALRNNPNVAYVERSATAHAHGQVTPDGTARIGASANSGLRVGDGRDERVDVDVAVIDSGIDHTHPDLHVVRRVNCVGVTSCVENAGMDDNGHGSNVAGIVGGLDNGIGYVGVAPGARLWSVTSLNSKGSGSTEEKVVWLRPVRPDAGRRRRPAPARRARRAHARERAAPVRGATPGRRACGSAPPGTCAHAGPRPAVRRPR